MKFCIMLQRKIETNNSADPCANQITVPKRQVPSVPETALGNHGYCRSVQTTSQSSRKPIWDLPHYSLDPHAFRRGPKHFIAQKGSLQWIWVSSIIYSFVSGFAALIPGNLSPANFDNKLYVSSRPDTKKACMLSYLSVELM